MWCINYINNIRFMDYFAKNKQNAKNIYLFNL